MNITTTVDGSTTTIALEGWLDTNTSPELGAALQDLDDGCESLVLDLANLEYISSAGLRLLVSAHKQMKGNLTIRNVSAEVMQVLHMAGFDRRLHIE
jgi:anti-sigma B factor antagonist